MLRLFRLLSQGAHVVQPRYVKSLYPGIYSVTDKPVSRWLKWRKKVVWPEHKSDISAELWPKRRRNREYTEAEEVAIEDRMAALRAKYWQQVEPRVQVAQTLKRCRNSEYVPTKDEYKLCKKLLVAVPKFVPKPYAR
jgi:hypothetical protein